MTPQVKTTKFFSTMTKSICKYFHKSPLEIKHHIAYMMFGAIKHHMAYNKNTSGF
jgi:hypothetical protein